MIAEPQRVALPALLRQGLLAYREIQGNEQKYRIKDNWKGQTHQLEPWQFFVLEVLPACEDFQKLASVFEDRFGHPITKEEVEQLFSLAADKNLFSRVAGAHPMVAVFEKKRASRPKGSPQGAAAEGGTSPEKQGPSPSAKNRESKSKKPSEGAAHASKDQLPAGLRDAVGLDDAVPLRGWKLFNPTLLVKLIYPFLWPFKYTVWLLPLLAITALFIGIHHADLIVDELNLLFSIGSDFASHVVIGLLTVNLLTTVVTALVAYNYRATVSGFCIVFYMWFLPRFKVQIRNAQQMSRRERIWLHAAPLLTRLALIALCILIWFFTKSMDNAIAPLAIVVAAIGSFSLFLTANPLIKSNGYHLMAAALNEPSLRGKSLMALMNKFRGNVYQKADNSILAAYALASSLFVLASIALFGMLLGHYMKIHFGGAGVLLTVLILLVLVLRLIAKTKKFGELYERSAQFERWRNISLPTAESDTGTKTSKHSSWAYLNLSVASLIVAGLLLPYHYEPGGTFLVLPNYKAELTSDVAGIIKEVRFDGGEVLKNGTVIARLDSTDYECQMRIFDAKVREQQAVVADLKARPKPEEIQVAERALEVEISRERYSAEKLDRYERLYKEKTISFEDLDDQRREHEVDVMQVAEKRANLKLIKTGVTPDLIAAAEAKLKSYQEERDYYQEKIKQSTIHMPFDGELTGMHLKQKVGHFLNKGEAFAIAENTFQVFAQIEVPEPDIDYVVGSAGVRGRPLSYHNEEFTGGVTAIDSIVTAKRSGNTVTVAALLDNKDGRLKSGMTGYAKISSQTMPTWEVMSRAIIRFFKVEVWSWIP